MPPRSTKSRPVPTPPTAPVLRYVENDPAAEDEQEMKPLCEWLEETTPPGAAFGELLAQSFGVTDSPVILAVKTGNSNMLTLRVVKLAPNASFVLCALDGVAVPVKVRRGMGGRLLKKTIQVERLDDGTLTHRP